MGTNLLIIGRGESVWINDFSFWEDEIWGLNDIVEIFRCDRQISWDNRVRDFKKSEKLKVHGGTWINEGYKLNKESGKVANFNTGLCFALNIAYHENFDRIFLLGFDNISHKNDRMDYNSLFNAINKYCKVFEKDMVNVYAVDSHIGAFNHISFNEFRLFAKNEYKRNSLM